MFISIFHCFQISGEKVGNFLFINKIITKFALIFNFSYLTYMATITLRLSEKTDKETSETLALIVHSRNKYQLAHLLEKGHAKRGGGRTAAQPHIAPAEEHGAEELESLIRRDLSKNG